MKAPARHEPPCHVETSQSISNASQLTGFYVMVMGTFVVNGLTLLSILQYLLKNTGKHGNKLEHEHEMS